jgi:hypothetical protein
MYRSRRHPFGQSGRKNYLTAVIEGFYQVVIRDISRFGVFVIQTDNPIGSSILFEYPVVLDFVDPALLTVTHGMKAEPGVWTDQLERVLCV